MHAFLRHERRAVEHAGFPSPSLIRTESRTPIDVTAATMHEVAVLAVAAFRRVGLFDVHSAKFRSGWTAVPRARMNRSKSRLGKVLTDEGSTALSACHPLSGLGT